MNAQATGPPPLPFGSTRSVCFGLTRPAGSESFFSVEDAGSNEPVQKFSRWSSRRGSNPHSIGYSGAQSGHVYREFHPARTIQFMVQPFGFRFIQVTAEENFGRTDLIKPSLLNVVLSEPTTISLVEPDLGTLSPKTFVAHCSFRFASGSTPMWPNGRGMSSILHHGTLKFNQ